MNKDIVLGWLKSDSAFYRVRAARHLSRSAHNGLEIEVRHAFHSEQVPWVKEALKRAMDAHSSHSANPSTAHNFQASDDYLDIISAVQSEAFDDSIGQMLHEVEPVIGALKVQLSQELSNYELSKSKSEIDRLDEVITAFSNWRRIERKPKFRETNVSEFLELITSSHPHNSANFEFHGNESLAVMTDVSLLKIIVSNAIRNSIEAINSLGTDSGGLITISHGKRNNFFWITIIDNGPGLSKTQNVLLKSQVSTKPGHKGFGLSLIERAVNVLEGSWQLSNGASGGAELFIELPIQGGS